MITSSPGWTIIKYKEEQETTESGIFIPSGEEREAIERRKSKRQVSMKKKPKNMYRWGEVVASDELGLGTKVYYSRFDVESDFIKNGVVHNVVLTKHLLAKEVMV